MLIGSGSSSAFGFASYPLVGTAPTMFVALTSRQGGPHQPRITEGEDLTIRNR